MKTDERGTSMPMIIPHHNTSAQPDSETTRSFREPIFEYTDLPTALELCVYAPGVDASGVEIVTDGPDLSITARKAHFVRPNFAGLHLEAVQHGYHLKLRLGNGYAFASLRAELADDRLTLWLPKRENARAFRPVEQRWVA